MSEQRSLSIHPELAPLVDSVSKVILGKTKHILYIISAWIANGHVLIEDVPGTGKTVLVKSLSKSLDLKFGRIQLTPDLLPSDIIGMTLYNEAKREFYFSKGPVFCDLLLADELNRATPRTQSALLEAMAEKQITVDAQTLPLSNLFCVIATQNPIEQHGTFPLPEAQLDRFMIRISLGLPDPKSEYQMLIDRVSQDPLEKIKMVAKADLLLTLRAQLAHVKTSQSIYEYILAIISKARSHPDVELPPSPRATLALAKIAQAYTLVMGQDYVRPTFVYELIPYVLAHRMTIGAEAKFTGKTCHTVLDEIIKSVRVPTK